MSKKNETGIVYIRTFAQIRDRTNGGGEMLKIFLAEDEVVVRETIKRMIPWEELGFELVGEAADGEMALPLLLRQQPDL